jgi:hypothetical protein
MTREEAGRRGAEARWGRRNEETIESPWGNQQRWRDSAQEEMMRRGGQYADFNWNENEEDFIQEERRGMNREDTGKRVGQIRWGLEFDEGEDEIEEENEIILFARQNQQNPMERGRYYRTWERGFDDTEY